MIEEYITNEWKTKKEILNELRLDEIYINERTFRLRVEALNKKFMEHELDYFIVHSSRGYKKTSEREEILKSLKENHKRAMNLLSKESKILKALNESENYNFDWE
jgi:predicted SprT family Zn-dependent metalloprotease